MCLLEEIWYTQTHYYTPGTINKTVQYLLFISAQLGDLNDEHVPNPYLHHVTPIKNEERNSSGQGQIIARVSVSGSAVKTERFATPQEATTLAPLSSHRTSEVTISLLVPHPFIDV